MEKKKEDKIDSINYKVQCECSLFSSDKHRSTQCAQHGKIGENTNDKEKGKKIVTVGDLVQLMEQSANVNTTKEDNRHSAAGSEKPKKARKKPSREATVATIDDTIEGDIDSAGFSCDKKKKKTQTPVKPNYSTEKRKKGKNKNLNSVSRNDKNKEKEKDKEKSCKPPNVAKKTPSVIAVSENNSNAPTVFEKPLDSKEMNPVVCITKKRSCLKWKNGVEDHGGEPKIFEITRISTLVYY